MRVTLFVNLVWVFITDEVVLTSCGMFVVRKWSMLEGFLPIGVAGKAVLEC